MILVKIYLAIVQTLSIFFTLKNINFQNNFPLFNTQKCS